MNESLTVEKSDTGHSETQLRLLPQPNGDFYLPGGRHVSKNVLTDPEGKQLLRKVIQPNQAGRLEVKYLPQDELLAAKRTDHDYTARAA